MPHTIRDILRESSPAPLLAEEETFLVTRARAMRGVHASNRGLASRRELLREELLPVMMERDSEVPLMLTGFIGSVLGLRADERGLRVFWLEDSGFCLSEEEMQTLTAAREQHGESIRTALSDGQPGSVLKAEMEGIIPMRDLVQNLQFDYGPPEELEAMLGIAVEVRAGTLAMRGTAEA